MKVARTNYSNHHTSKAIRCRHTLATLLPITDSKSAPVNVQRKDVIEILTEDEDEDEEVASQLAVDITEDLDERVVKRRKLNENFGNKVS